MNWEDFKCECRGHKEKISINDCICSPHDAEDLSQCDRSDKMANLKSKEDLK